MTKRINSTITKLMCVGALAALLTAAVTIAAQKPEDAETLLQTARKKEVVDGDRAGAIETYKKAFAAAKSNPATAAMALVHMAELYQKMGDAQSSKKAYEQVVKDYPDQTEAVTLAKAAVGGPEKPNGMNSRLVWSAPAVRLFTVSPDGRYLPFREGFFKLSMREIGTGLDRPIDGKIPGDDAIKGAYVGSPLISKDGRQLVFIWSGNGKVELRLASVSGNPRPRRLYSSSAEIINFWPLDWAPDGRTVAVDVRRKDASAQLALVSVSDGSLRVLKSLEWRALSSSAFFSPDGRWLGFSLPETGEARQSDVFVLAVDGSREIHAVSHRANDAMIGWSPDGRWLLFSSDRSGATDLWGAPFDSRGSVGSPRLLKAGFERASSLGITRSGTLYYEQAKNGEGSRIGLATIDIDTGRVVRNEFSQPVRQSNISPRWSPDGKKLAYFSRRPEGNVLVIRSDQAIRSRELKPELVLQNLDSWAPDGRSLVVTGRDSKGRYGIHRVDAETGEVKPLAPTAGGGIEVGSIRWTPDGRSLMFASAETTFGPGLYRVDVESGNVSQIIASQPPGLMPLTNGQYSPDGRRLYQLRETWLDRAVGKGGLVLEGALVEVDLSSGKETKLKVEIAEHPFRVFAPFLVMPDGQHVLITGDESGSRVLRLIPLDGGEPRDLMRVPQNLQSGGGYDVLYPLGVVSGGSAVLVAKSTREPLGEREADLWLVPLLGGEPRKIGDLGFMGSGRFDEKALSPDGRNLAYYVMEGRDRNATQEVWALENFLPKSATK